MTVADAFIAEFEVDCEEHHENVLYALWREFTKEVQLLNDTTNSEAFELEIDPEEIVEMYFFTVERGNIQTNECGRNRLGGGRFDII